MTTEIRSFFVRPFTLWSLIFPKPRTDIFAPSLTSLSGFSQGRPSIAQRQLGKLKDERSQAMENSSGNIEWIEQFKKYRHLTELDRECIVHLIEKILIYDGKRIEVCFRYKDELENALQYIERFENVLPAEEGVTMLERRNA